MRLIPEITEPTVEAVLEALLKHHTCGALLTILASIHEKRASVACRTCADALLSILELRRGVIYVKDEPTRNWSSLSAVQIPLRRTTTGRIPSAAPDQDDEQPDADDVPDSLKGADVTVL